MIAMCNVLCLFVAFMDSSNVQQQVGRQENDGKDDGANVKPLE